MTIDSLTWFIKDNGFLLKETFGTFLKQVPVLCKPKFGPRTKKDI